jgi:maltose alpha-D-glucosyltransferase/alpha-amylase
MGAEQSNTSLRFGRSLIVKVIRRLQPGPNPDEEVLRALAGSGFPQVPRYVGGASWRSHDGTAYPIALAQAFVPNEGNGWSWTLARLGDVEPRATEPGHIDGEAERLLGRRTGEMHIALSLVGRPGFTPRFSSPDDTADDVARVRAAASAAVSLLHDREAQLPDRLRERLPEIAAGLLSATARASGFRDEVGRARIRVHGDFHLGQTLRTTWKDWVIVDFEGEPARPVAERRRRQSPLKDVAGMLRSFGYARGVAEQSATPEAVPLLEAWERRARRTFLEGYRNAIAGSVIPLAPDDDDAFARALAAWELDKSLYEIAYEARNRPDWIAIPLRALLPDVVDQAEGDGEGAPALPWRGAQSR